MKMSNSTIPPRFKPLGQASQGSSEDVVYYDTQASREAKLEYLLSRTQGLLGLSIALHELDNAPTDAVQKINSVYSMLLSDGISVIKHISQEDINK